jgi:hypothetical protein
MAVATAYNAKSRVNMSEKRSFPPLDLYAIEFPSDKVTLGRVRQVENACNGGHAFSSAKELDNVRATEIHAIVPLHHEMLLAEKAYAKALGLPDPDHLMSRGQLVRDLREQWKEDDISSGPQQSTQLIRNIEQAAIRQAKRHLGMGR